MNDQARKLLAFVIHRYGTDVIQTPKQLQALLKDHAKGQFKPEIALFMQAVTEGLVAKLLTNQYLSVQSLSTRAIKHLQQDCFIEEQAAHWVIDSWCIALKLARPIPIHTTPAPVAQTKPSPVTVTKSPVSPPTPTVQATPVPVTFLVVVVFLAILVILSKQDETPAGVTQTEETQKLSDALHPYPGVHLGLDPLGQERIITETQKGNLFYTLQHSLLGIDNSPYGTDILNPNVPQYLRDQQRKLSRHIPAPGLYTPEGKPSEKLLEGVKRVKFLQIAYRNLQQNGTTDPNKTPEQDFKEAVDEYYDSDPDLYLDGNAYLKGLHDSTDAQRELEKIKNRVAQKTQTTESLTQELGSADTNLTVTESLAQESSQAQIASQPEMQTRGVWTTDWGNDVIGAVTIEPCFVAELKNQGYVYALASSIPLARLKHNADAWKIVGDRAITVIGCWFKKDANNTGLIHAKFKRKKDDKIWEDDLNLADGSWTFKRID